jgi:hypothetical protein
MMEQELLQAEKKPNVLAFQIALLFSFYIIALTFAMELMGMGAEVTETSLIQKIVATTLSYVPFIVAIYYVQAKHKKELGGYITFGRAFSAGFKVAAYSGLFIGILILIYYKILNQAGFEKIIESAIAQAGTGEAAEKGIEMMQKYMIIFLMFGIAVTYTIWGLIISLVTAAIIKKERPVFFQSHNVDSDFPAQP